MCVETPSSYGDCNRYCDYKSRQPAVVVPPNLRLLQRNLLVPGLAVDCPSSEVTFLGFFLWRHLNTFIYGTAVETEEDLVARFPAARESIQKTPGIFERMRQNMVRRCSTCNEDGD